ncbi:glycosyltransferase family 4 protein [Synechococcus sp. RedBA-s]|uniref:glycosyltransferase family 4 protein n=1 Tax=Synechococcus sp. RedBA-s TaxID=2823741 RepID=UPI0020CCC493|nr:glycosyltransferase family 4 protein [Synechococcus sp. RedBA-s]MCP9801755.1 glycosyltransferase family 4 protein [Synechococcus sp. RedBA-s]
MSELSIFHPSGQLVRPSNPFGKDIANAQLYRGLLSYGGYKRIHILNQLGLTDEQLSQGLDPSGDSQCAISGGSLMSTEIPARCGVLLRGQPYLSELAWIRRRASSDSAYSLVGLIHTIAPPAIRESIGAAAIAPVHEWDALICTSPSVHQSMVQMFDSWNEHLSERLGACRSPRPQLPIIPLAVDVEAIAENASNLQARQRLRSKHAIAEDESLVLWVGRLSFYEKAFPQSMFQALQDASVSSGQRVHFGLYGWFPGGEEDRKYYLEAAAACAPDVNVIFWDGNDKDLLADCWAAADIFLSLVDNIQETFGLTPVEAMAAGLPVVASDWDGYRATVRNGLDGFLIPTLAAPGSRLGGVMADLHALGLETYQGYVGSVAQHTAVHVGRAAEALRLLITSPQMRAAMGASAARRARECFSWPVVIAQYKELFQELAARRETAALNQAPRSRIAVHPLRGEPFADFVGFATQVLRPGSSLRLRGESPDTGFERFNQVALNRAFSRLHGTPEEARRILVLVGDKPGLNPADLLQAFPPARAEFIILTIVWLAKLGLLDWLESSPGPPSIVQQSGA